MQCCLDLPEPTLHKKITCTMLAHTPQTTLHKKNNLQCFLDLSGLCNVGPWLTDNFYEENNLYNVVSTMLGQHCIGILSKHCCPNMSEKTLPKKITYAMLAQSAQTYFRRKITYTMLSDLPVPALHKKITCAMLTHSPRITFHKKIICNVILINVGQHCARTLTVQCWSMVNKQFFLAK